MICVDCGNDEAAEGLQLCSDCLLRTEWENIPSPVIEERNGRLILRDDRLPGGTKRRVLPVMMSAAEQDEFVYGGPAAGYAQLAGAISAAAVGKRWTVFIAERSRWHPLTEAAAVNGARIVEVPHGRMSVVQARAREYAAEHGALHYPLGFDVPEFHALLLQLVRSLPIAEPPQVWATAGSGALTRALQAAWPSAEHFAVRIGMPPDPGRARLFIAPERFEDPAKEPPPFPSCSNYDAKAWRFFEERAKPGALFWNVAG